MSYAYDDNKLISLGQLKRAIERDGQELSSLAAHIVGVVNDLTRHVAISIATSAWVATADATIVAAGYPLMATVPASWLSANANVTIRLDFASVAAASEAGVCETALVSAGAVTLYAKLRPRVALTGTLDAAQIVE